jgi:hypothetical protein
MKAEEGKPADEAAAERGQLGSGDVERGNGHVSASWIGPMICRRKGDVKKKHGCSVSGVRGGKRREVPGAGFRVPGRQEKGGVRLSAVGHG